MNAPLGRNFLCPNQGVLFICQFTCISISSFWEGLGIFAKKHGWTSPKFLPSGEKVHLQVFFYFWSGLHYILGLNSLVKIPCPPQDVNSVIPLVDLKQTIKNKKIPAPWTSTRFLYLPIKPNAAETTKLSYFSIKPHMYRDQSYDHEDRNLMSIYPFMCFF